MVPVQGLVDAAVCQLHEGHCCWDVSKRLARLLKVLHLNHMHSSSVEALTNTCEDDPDAFPRLSTAEL